MARLTRRLLSVAFLGGALALPAARAQTPALQPPSATSARTPPPDLSQLVNDIEIQQPVTSALWSGWEPAFLQSLPRPPDQPRSLFEPAPPLGPPPADLERPFFWWGDPILDSPQWPQPGWFYNVQIGIVKPHVVNEQNNLDHPIVTHGGKMASLELGNAQLSETISPRIEIGYRLPSGFGQLAVADRFFSSSGSGPYNTSSGPSVRSSRMSINYTDFDYGSWEYTPWANWNMMWIAGVRQEETYNRTRVDLPFGQAAAGRGIFAAQATNATGGAGMHFAVQLERKFAQTGFSFINRFDPGDTFSRVRQNFSADFTSLTPSGRPEAGFVKEAVWMQIPMVNWLVGVSYQPPKHPQVRIFAGYMFDAWWNVLRRTGTTSNGNFTDQGAVLQVGINF